MHLGFSMTRFLDNRDCIPSHRVDLPMSAVGPFGKNAGAKSPGRPTFSAIFRDSRGSWDAWQPTDASTSPLPGACGGSMPTDARSLWAGNGNGSCAPAAPGPDHDGRE